MNFARNQTASEIVIQLVALSQTGLFALTSSTANEVFAHYIFMENAFSLPTASGLPLKVCLTSVFAPGAKGGLTYSFANVTKLLITLVYL